MTSRLRITWLSACVMISLMGNVACSNEGAGLNSLPQSEKKIESEPILNSPESEVSQDLTAQIECIKALSIKSDNEMIKLIVAQPDLAISHKNYAPEILNDDDWERLANFYELASQECVS